MMKKLAIILIGLVLVLVQLSVTNHIVLLGVHVDLLLIYAVILAIYVDTKTDYIAIVSLAAISDSLISTTFGVGILTVVLVTHIVKRLLDVLRDEKQWSVALLFTVSAIISTVIRFGVNQLLFIPEPMIHLPILMVQKILVQVFFGLILTALLKPTLNQLMKNWW